MNKRLITIITAVALFSIFFFAFSLPQSLGRGYDFLLSSVAFHPFLASPAPGTLDPLDLSLEGQTINAALVQPDGKIIVGGKFSRILGTPRSNIARIKFDGTNWVLDDFAPKVAGPIYALAIQPDGKILIGGQFSQVQNGDNTPVVRNNFARVDANGILDSFDPNPNSLVFSIAVQSDNKILLGGLFTSPRPYLARFNADGSADWGFNPSVNGYVSSVLAQKDGKVVVGGFFSSPKQYIARLNTDGSLDGSFNNPTINSGVMGLAMQADGKIILGGYFSSPRQYIARLNTDGSLDGFDPRPDNGVISLAVQADGKVLLGGYFGSVQSVTRNHIARVNIDGSLDGGFNPNANDVVNTIALQDDGKVLLGGDFKSLQPYGYGLENRNYFARLFNDPIIRTYNLTASVSSGRGSITPAGIVSVNGGTNQTFNITADTDYKIEQVLVDGGIVTSPNAPTFNYSYTFANVTANHTITASFVPLSPYEKWQMANFSSTEIADANISGTDADPDHDGISNLIEYAFNLNPKASGASSFQYSGVNNLFTLQYRQNVNATDLTFTIETSTNLNNWNTATMNTSFTQIDNNTRLATSAETNPMTGNRFFRLKVTKTSGQTLGSGFISPTPVGPARITIIKTGSGTGKTVGRSINCGDVCSGDVTVGTKMILYNTADSGSNYIGMTGPSIQCKPGTACSFTVNGSMTFTVQFDQNTDDTTPPSIPTNISGTVVSNSSITLTWSPSTDNVGVTGYIITRNGQAYGGTPRNTLTDTDLTPGVPYTYSIKARDYSENESAQSADYTITIPAN